MLCASSMQVLSGGDVARLVADPPGDQHALAVLEDDTRVDTLLSDHCLRRLQSNQEEDQRVHTSVSRVGGTTAQLQWNLLKKDVPTLGAAILSFVERLSRTFQSITPSCLPQ